MTYIVRLCMYVCARTLVYIHCTCTLYVYIVRRTLYVCACTSVHVHLFTYIVRVNCTTYNVRLCMYISLRTLITCTLYDVQCTVKTCEYTRIRTSIQMHRCTYTHVHTRAHTRAHTCAHTRAQPLDCFR